MRTRTLMLLAAITLALGAAAVPAHAYDITGHWVGKWSCKGFDGGKFTAGNKTSTMDVTQVQGTFAVAIDAAFDNFTYNGSAIRTPTSRTRRARSRSSAATSARRSRSRPSTASWCAPASRRS